MIILISLVRPFLIARGIVGLVTLACAIPEAAAQTGNVSVLWGVTHSIIEPRALNFERGAYGTCINGQTFQIDALVSFKGWQYATYFDAGRRLCVARRQLPSNRWQRIAFDDYTINHNDVHNVAVIGICPTDGTVHLAFDHHGSPLHYRVSRAGAATAPEKTEWTAALFGATTAELVKGHKLSGVTYPAFFSAPDGRLQLCYRIGGSGNGSSHLALYDPAKGGWTIHGQFIGNEGDYQGSKARNAYHNGFDYDAKGRLHTTWVWREEQNNREWGPSNCHDLQYAFSDDGGRSWLNNDGVRCGTTGRTPMRLQSEKITVHEARWRWGMMNQLTQTATPDGQPHVILWQNPPDAPAASKNMNAWRYFHYWRDDRGGWHRRLLPFVGRKPSIVADPAGNLIVVFTKPDDMEYHGADPGGPLHIFKATAAKRWDDWVQLFRSEKSFVGEPRVDKYYWQQEQILSIYAQETPTKPGQPSTLLGIDFKLVDGP